MQRFSTGSNSRQNPDRPEDRGRTGPKSRSRSPPPWRNREQNSSYDRRENRNDFRRGGLEGRKDPERSARERARQGMRQEDEQMREWVSQEDAFALKQAKKRAEIRVKEGRAKPVDYLAVDLRFIDAERSLLDDEIDPEDLEIVDPVKLFDQLNQTQLKELKTEVDAFLKLETNALNRDYWTTMSSICKDRLERSSQGNSDRAVSSVAADIDKILSPKTHDQLEALQVQVQKKLDSNEDIDYDYWNQLLQRLLIWKAKAKLGKIFESVSEAKSKLTSGKPAKSKAATFAANASNKDSGPQDEEAALFRRLMAQKASGQADNASHAVTSYHSTRFAAVAKDDPSDTTKDMYEREVAQGFDEDEEVFAGEEEVGKAQPEWAGTHRPRKPKYFNRVQMGYEWNKYNQTHYDQDNPPPKVVQGYKFNIFYPELIDKSKAPTYKIEREGGRKRGQSFAPAGEDDTCVIRFIAGAPYEDVAFRIVDKEWDYSAKRASGFKCTFEKGVLQLHVQFKKIFYRK